MFSNDDHHLKDIHIDPFLNDGILVNTSLGDIHGQDLNYSISPFDFVPVSPTGPPCTIEYSGYSCFRVQIDGSNTHKKKFLYSNQLNRLFLNSGHNFSVNFEWDTTKVLPPVYVRATMVFSDPCDAEKRVETCYQHYASCDGVKALPENIRHNVLRSAREAGAPDVFYCGAPASADSWYSVLVRFPAPSSHAFHFVCKNSCSSGINRRPLSLVFTLESKTGEVYGRQIVGVRSCSCPKRDMCKAETTALSPSDPGLPQSNPAPAVNSTTPSRKRIKLEDGECDTLVTLPAVAVPGARVALAGLRVMRDMLLQTRAVQLRARQDVRAVERGLAELAAAADAVRGGGGGRV